MTERKVQIALIGAEKPIELDINEAETELVRLEAERGYLFGAAIFDEDGHFKGSIRFDTRIEGDRLWLVACIRCFKKHGKLPSRFDQLEKEFPDIWSEITSEMRSEDTGGGDEEG